MANPRGHGSPPMTRRVPIIDTMEPDEIQTADQLLPLVYAELRRLAAHKMARENPGQTLQPTALVHEAWLKLGGEQSGQWRNRNHFFAAAAEAMRRILTDNARRKLRVRHGGDQQRVDLDDCATAAESAAGHVLAVSEALQKFAQLDPKRAELVKLRYFVGLTFEEAAEVLDISVPTAKRYWSFARAWLYEEIRAGR
jgi:RNA polymerase sigma factor (TIGR02999 family)